MIKRVCNVCKSETSDNNLEMEEYVEGAEYDIRINILFADNNAISKGLDLCTTCKWNLIAQILDEHNTEKE